MCEAVEAYANKKAQKSRIEGKREGKREGERKGKRLGEQNTRIEVFRRMMERGFSKEEAQSISGLSDKLLAKAMSV